MLISWSRNFVSKLFWLLSIYQSVVMYFHTKHVCLPAEEKEWKKRKKMLWTQWHPLWILLSDFRLAVNLCGIHVHLKIVWETWWLNTACTQMAYFALCISSILSGKQSETCWVYGWLDLMANNMKLGARKARLNSVSCLPTVMPWGKSFTFTEKLLHLQ